MFLNNLQKFSAIVNRLLWYSTLALRNSARTFDNVNDSTFILFFQNGDREVEQEVCTAATPLARHCSTSSNICLQYIYAMCTTFGDRGIVKSFQNPIQLTWSYLQVDMTNLVSYLSIFALHVRRTPLYSNQPDQRTGEQMRISYFDEEFH